MFKIEFTADALGDLRTLRKFDQKTILDGIESKLRKAPTTETRNLKKLRPNEVAEWEIRVGKFRVLYNIMMEEHIVSIEAIGYKIGNMLFVRGKEKKL